MRKGMKLAGWILAGAGLIGLVGVLVPGARDHAIELWRAAEKHARGWFAGGAAGAPGRAPGTAANWFDARAEAERLWARLK